MRRGYYCPLCRGHALSERTDGVRHRPSSRQHETILGCAVFQHSHRAGPLQGSLGTPDTLPHQRDPGPAVDPWRLLRRQASDWLASSLANTIHVARLWGAGAMAAVVVGGPERLVPRPRKRRCETPDA
jgi:hypothetical protein